MSNDLFWSRVVKTTGGCWRWSGQKYPNGHGKCNYQGETQRAARVAWIIAHGVLLTEQRIVNTCGNVACVKPEHHRIGIPFVGDNRLAVATLAAEPAQLVPGTIITIRSYGAMSSLSVAKVAALNADGTVHTINKWDRMRKRWSKSLTLSHYVAIVGPTPQKFIPREVGGLHV